MTYPRLLAAAALMSALALVPASTEARSHHYGLPYDISYSHNYGPGSLPGSFAYYDGPATNHCDRGAATYIGQDHRRHPCF